ncbi:hypothetical protein CN204_17930 [Sinorhizobium meliloti]|nr:hypothetical protein SMRU11_01610 [Sinorhizobium meliloti RU11/001]RVG58988.1 hypothetical protein CN222_29245 [Sinorhizobium meliloti]RVG90185.1 hypothetical protein CN221_25520 [Sinorhizobium meliloti]RVH61116.1 hypothetical protein CN209_23860 [Sinorhizobium meliloti]RVH83337.1 hypothetical protein CN204_17930 [Sinorhizobium meliloti]
MLKHRKLVPGVEGDNGLQHRRQVFSLAQHAPPFFEPGILVPVEIIDERIFFRRAATARPGRVCDRSFGAGQHCVDGGIVHSGKIFDVVDIFALPFRIVRNRAPSGTRRLNLVSANRRDLRRLAQRPQTVGGQRPVR